MSDHSRRRGSYAKGLAKREEILERALEVIAREGYDSASVKQIADAVDLSQAGLLHYFGSKEELFTEILRKRDEADLRTYAPHGIESAPRPDIREIYVSLARHNAEVPGLVELFSRLAVSAADPEHPAHEFFLSRSTELRRLFAGELAARQTEGTTVDGVAPDILARLLQAVADGLQLQRLLEPDLDMAAVIDVMFDLLDGTAMRPTPPA